MKQQLATTFAAVGFALALLCASAESKAAWEVRYAGPDQVFLVERPNSAGHNLTRSGVHAKELIPGRLASALEPILANAFERCAPQGSGMVTVKPANMADHIGDTSQRISGLGIYLNLPDADRVSMGHFYIAPFFVLNVTFAPEGGAEETADLFEFDRLEIVGREDITQGKFLETPAANLMPTVLNFAKTHLPAAMHKAFPGRCPAP